MIWWLVSARTWFKGPKVNLDHLMLGRDDQAAEIQAEDGDFLEGKPPSSSSGSETNVTGEMPSGKSVGDMKPEGL